MVYNYVDCFSVNIRFWQCLGIWPADFNYKYFNIYSRLFVSFSVFFYIFLLTINFGFLSRQIDIFVGEMIFYFTELAVLSKILTFFFLRDKIKKILGVLECELFRPDDEHSSAVAVKAKVFIVRYWRIVAVVSITSNLTHVLSPFIAHIFLPIPLALPVSSYSFLPDEIRNRFIYPLYFYQSIGMHFHMLYNLNIDCFFLGLMILTIAQLRILYVKLENVTGHRWSAASGPLSEQEASTVLVLNKCIIRYDEISKFCYLVQEVFSATLFVQFGMASCIICTCLFRFTLPAAVDYYVFLATYMAVMIVQIMVPCWFGTRIIHASTLLSTAVYNCDWTPRSRQFKSSMRLFVERANKPLSITGGKMFPLSLETFTSIMNSAYSFFTLLRHLQSR